VIELGLTILFISKGSLIAAMAAKPKL